MSATPNPSFPPASEPLKKPISGRHISWLIAGVLAIAVCLSMILSFLMTSQPKVQPGEVQQATGSPTVKKFSGDVDRAGDIIKQNAQNASRVASVAEALHVQLPECNQHLRDQLKGEYYVVHSHDPNTPDINLACQPDDQWLVLPPAIGQMQPETRAQTVAETRTSATGGVSKAEKLKLRRQAALQSNPIPLHFADHAQQTSAARESEPAETADIDQETARQPAGTSADASFPPAQAQPAPAAEPSNVEQARRQQLGIQLSHYVGPQYPIFQSRIIEGLLANRLIGEQGGPVKVQVSTPVYSQDAQHLLIPPGSVLLGESLRVENGGEHRLAVVFHRIIMPDGWSFILDPTRALDQQGAGGLTGRLDRHLASLIGTAVMVGAIEGLSDFSNVGAGSGAVVEVQGGISRESSSEAMQILRRALNRPPGITIYEGTRVRVWVARDQALPIYENHIVTTTVE